MSENGGLRRRRIILATLSTAIAVIIIGILLLGQTTPQAPTTETPIEETPVQSPTVETPTVETPNQETPTNEVPDIEIPENLFVVPEVPYGTIAILLAMLSALLIMQKRSKKKLQ